MKFEIESDNQNKVEEILNELIKVYDKEYKNISQQAKGKLKGKFPMVKTDFIPEESFAHQSREGDKIIFQTSLYIPKFMFLMKVPIRKAEGRIRDLLKKGGVNKVKVKCVKD